MLQTEKRSAPADDRGAEEHSEMANEATSSLSPSPDDGIERELLHRRPKLIPGRWIDNATRLVALADAIATDDRLKGAHSKVLIAGLRGADANGVVGWKLKTWAKRTKLGKRTIRGALNDLEQWDYLTIAEYRRPDRTKGANVYRFNDRLLTSAAKTAGLVEDDSARETSAAKTAGLVSDATSDSQVRQKLPVDKCGKNCRTKSMVSIEDTSTDVERQNTRGASEELRCEDCGGERVATGEGLHCFACEGAPF